MWFSFFGITPSAPLIGRRDAPAYLRVRDLRKMASTAAGEFLLVTNWLSCGHADAPQLQLPRLRDAHAQHLLLRARAADSRRNRVRARPGNRPGRTIGPGDRRSSGAGRPPRLRWRSRPS